MGYDLTWCELPREVLQAQEHAMGGDGGEEDWEPYCRACDTTGCTFYANIWSMDVLRQEMAGQGMLKDVELIFPDPGDYGLSNPIPDPMIADADKEAAAYRRFYDDFHAVRTLDTRSGGIPIQKLWTMDFWHVTSSEIESALTAASEYPCSHARDLVDPRGNTLVAELRAAGVSVQLPRLADGGEFLQLWRRWLAFLRGASRHGGFIVS
jgi:hypothetical protein